MRVGAFLRVMVVIAGVPALTRLAGIRKFRLTGASKVCLNIWAFLKHQAVWVGLAAVVLVATPGISLGQAHQITYTLDPSQSMLYLEGTYAGHGFFSTGSPFIGDPGPINGHDSQTAFYTGTITAERDATANTLQITGANVVAENNGPFIPPSTTPVQANYGFYVPVPETGTGGGYVADFFLPCEIFHFPFSAHRSTLRINLTPHS